MWRSLTTGGGTCTIQPSRPRGRSHLECCCVCFPGAVIVITTTSPSFSHACACHVFVYVCTCTYRNPINKCTNMISTAVPWGVLRSNFGTCFGTKYDANLKGMYYCQVYFINLSIHQHPDKPRRVPFKIQYFALFSLWRRPSNKVIWPRNATALPTELYSITWLSSSVGSASINTYIC